MPLGSYDMPITMPSARALIRAYSQPIAANGPGYGTKKFTIPSVPRPVIDKWQKISVTSDQRVHCEVACSSFCFPSRSRGMTPDRGARGVPFLAAHPPDTLTGRGPSEVRSLPFMRLGSVQPLSRRQVVRRQALRLFGWAATAVMRTASIAHFVI